jgi:hypothetical protein
MQAEIGHSRPPFTLQDQDARNAIPLDDEIMGDHLDDIEEGMAVAWSCVLLYEVMPITKGRRFILGTHLFG